jgi:hypothetical protein
MLRKRHVERKSHRERHGPEKERASHSTNSARYASGIALPAASSTRQRCLKIPKAMASMSAWTAEEG